MTLPEPKFSYTMTLSDVPEWPNRVHLTTEKSSSDKGTQRAGISVPEESTYLPSIRKMISPAREFSTNAQGQTTRTDQVNSEKVKRSRKVNTKVVETPSKSKHQAGHWPKWGKKQSESKLKNDTQWSTKMRWKQVEKLDEASRPNPAKTKAKSNTSEVQRWRLPKDVSGNKDQEKSTEVYKSTEPRRQSSTDLRLSHRRSNELQRGMTMSKDVSYRQSKDLPGISLPRSGPATSTNSTRILLMPPIASATRSRLYSLPSRLPSQAASGSQCHLPMTTACEIFHEALHEGSRDRRHASIWYV